MDDLFRSIQPAVQLTKEKQQKDLGQMLIYKVVASSNGFKELEKEVSLLLNKGWKPVGGVAFNQGHAYQAMVGNIGEKIERKSKVLPENTIQPLGAVDAMRKIDELT